MPILSTFYGIVIRMYFFDDRHHHLAHVHAEHAGKHAVFSIDTAEILAGEMPSGKARLVKQWIELHREELQVDWQLALNGDELFRIDPLK